jgi:RNA polymerase sigma factor (sigma-70 family)
MRNNDFGKHYKEFGAYLWTMCRAHGVPSADRPDLMQEFYLRLYIELCTLSDSEVEEMKLYLRGWAARVMRNMLIDWRRRGKAAKRGGGKVQTSGDLGRSAERDTGSEPESDRAEMLELLRHWLSLLSERERSALTLRLAAGLKYQQIGAAMGLSTSSAQELVVKAQRRLEEFMRGEEPRPRREKNTKGEEAAPPSTPASTPTVVVVRKRGVPAKKRSGE